MNAPTPGEAHYRDLLARAGIALRAALQKSSVLCPDWKAQEPLLVQDTLARQKPK